MALPVEILLGIYLGLLTGIVPAFVAGALGFLVRYFSGVSLPGFGVVVLALSIASVQGGLLGLVEPDIAQSPRLLVAVLIVLMLALYAHSQGDKLGAELPRRLSFTQLRQRTLSADVVDLVGSVGRVTVRPIGDVRDVEGYPALSPALRSTIREGSWELPADLPLSELERRLEERLRTDHDLADVSVSIDERARATIAAAPPTGRLSDRLPAAMRAVSVPALVPTGLARGDEVVVRTDDASIAGTVLSARGEADADGDPDPPSETLATDGGEEDATAPTRSGTASAGGDGRVTVAVPRRDAPALLEAQAPQLLVRSRGTSREFEALSLLKRAGHGVGRAVVGPTAATVDPSDSAPDVTVLAIRRRARPLERRGRQTRSDFDGSEWTIRPDPDATLEAGDELFVAGPERAVDGFVEEIAR